ncbi:MAG: ATP-binding protein [Kofleriaceae bacterium]
MSALREGLGQLDHGMAALEKDLRASVSRPRAVELGRVADGLRRMADRLSDSRERERDLETSLAHEQRLGALGRVVAGVAHEVRNPLTGIKLHLDMVVRNREASNIIVDDARAALREVGRLDDLVRSLLVVARRSPSRQRIDLNDVVEERLRLLAGFAREREVRLEHTGTATVSIDHDAFTRAIDNVLRNAVEASPRGEVVRVEIRSDSAAVLVDVLDHGPGLPPGLALFEPFATTKPDGVGLGAFIAQSLVLAIGGDITYSREDSWTRMRISLPMS